MLLRGLDLLERFALRVLREQMELDALVALSGRKGVQLENCEWREVAWGICTAPQYVPIVEARSKAVGESCIFVTKDSYLKLEFPVGHSCSFAVDDVKVG